MSGLRPTNIRHDYEERNATQATGRPHLSHALLSGTQLGGLLRRRVVRKMVELGLLLRGQAKRIRFPWLAEKTRKPENARAAQQGLRPTKRPASA
jgi:hypothetical protein